MINKKIEILAPCGSMEAFNAAVNAGADACYLAGQRFGARAYADNFDVEELCRVIDKAHLKGVKVYMTVNTLFKNAEIKILTEYLRPVYEAGLDAFIIQDLGVFKILKEAFPEISLHASTQMNICSAEGAMMLKELGASRVIPARELSLEEIRDIKSKVDIEVETFVHGAMCYCYSGRCLLSSMIGDRSGNRGRCAQPCRKKYDDEYLLSMKDMCALKAVPGLIDAGVDSLKIEGRMKGEYYTAAVVNAYKEIAYDCINNHFSEKKCERLSRRLADIFNRGGFSTGYFYPENTDDMLDVETPGHKGVLVGKVRNAGQGKVNILCTDNISKKDVLLIKTKEGSIELTSDKDAKKGDRITLNAMKSGSILADSDIYRKLNYSLMQEIREKILLNDKLMQVSLKCIIKSNEPLRLSLSNDDITVQVEGGIVQPAKTAGISSDSIRDKIAAFGNTGYYPVEVSIENDGRSFASFSELKSLRRELLAKLEDEILSRYRRNSDTNDNSDAAITAEDIDYINDNDPIEDINTKIIHFNLENMTEADRLLSVLEQYEKKTEYIVSFDVDSFTIKELCELTGKFSDYSKTVLAFPYIHRERDEKYFETLFEEELLNSIDTFYIRNIDDLAMVRKYNKKLMLASSIYIYNDASVEYLNEIFGSSVYSFELPHELTETEMSKLSFKAENLKEIFCFGHENLMITEQKPYKSKTFIKDEHGGHYRYIQNEKMCYNRLIDRKLLFLPEVIKDFLSNNEYNILKIDLLDEGSEDIKALLDMIFKQDDSIINIFKKKNIFTTKGHFDRNIL